MDAAPQKAVANSENKPKNSIASGMQLILFLFILAAIVLDTHKALQPVHFGSVAQQHLSIAAGTTVVGVLAAAEILADIFGE